MKNGYYWVKYFNGWQIAWRDESSDCGVERGWYLVGDLNCYQDDDMDEIGETVERKLI